MSKNDEQRIAARLAKIMAMICVRNSKLEELHAGQVPTTHTGDYSDVFVVDDDEMRALMRDIVNRLYTFHLCAEAPGLQAEVARWMAVASRWDEPAIDQKMLAHRAEPH
jgi:hypothetical protein